jgi:hypothetical protein
VGVDELAVQVEPAVALAVARALPVPTVVMLGGLGDKCPESGRVRFAYDGDTFKLQHCWYLKELPFHARHHFAAGNTTNQGITVGTGV